MNSRRSFLSSILKLGVAAAILPAATTYARTWKVVEGSEIWVPNPEWVSAPFEIAWIAHPASTFTYNAARYDLAVKNKTPMRFRLFNGKIITCQP